MDLLIATNNPDKIEEIKSLLDGLQGLRVLTPSELNLNLDISEDGSTYADNAQLKALAFSRESGLSALADDSGLEVDALNAAPGLFSARYAPKKGATAADRRAYLLAKLSKHDPPWTAQFISTLCLALPNGKVYFAIGSCKGEIIAEERGSNGFGYDPIFLVAGQGKTMAELTMQEKNILSHRAKAVSAMRARLKNLIA